MVWFAFCCCNSIDQNQLEEERAYLILHFINLTSREAKAGTPGETMFTLLSYLSCTDQANLLRSGTTRSELGPPTSTSTRKNATGQFDRGNSSIEIPSSRYVKLICKISYHMHLIAKLSRKILSCPQPSS